MDGEVKVLSLKDQQGAWKTNNPQAPKGPWTAFYLYVGCSIKLTCTFLTFFWELFELSRWGLGLSKPAFD